MAKNRSLTEQLARRVKRIFRENLAEYAGDFGSKAELRSYLAQRLNDDDTIDILERWARTQVDRTYYLQCLDLDALWSACKRRHKEIDREA